MTTMINKQANFALKSLVLEAVSSVLSVRQRILEKLFWLEANFDDILPRSLSNKLSRYYKLRVGDWRIVYLVIQEAQEISVIAIDHRKNIYNRIYELE